METVRIHGPLSRAEISVHTALSFQTISNLVDDLVHHGVLEAGERRQGRRGQPAIELNINPQGGYAVGLHLDRDHFTGVLMDLVGQVHQVARREWNFPLPAEAIACCIETVHALTCAHGLETKALWGVGVGLPGPLDSQASRLVSPPNFPGWSEVPLRELLAEKLALPVFLETDATAAAVGERWLGQGRGVSDYFYIYLGIGVGGGMILEGKPYRGGLHNAAMFGHIPVGPDSDRCSCGGSGCLERYVSLASLYDALEAGGRPRPGHVDALTHLLAQNDSLLLAWLAQAADRLARALVIIENLFNPISIIFGGRLPAPLIDWLLQRLEQQLPKVQMRGLQNHPRLVRAQAMDNAAALGAAILPLFERITPGHYSLGKTAMLFPTLPTSPVNERTT